MQTRTDKSIKNIIAGLSNKFLCITMPFITRTFLIYILGIEYAGLNNLFISILQILNLAELGLSNSIIYCLYKPVAENNKEEICAILNFIKTVYLKIGLFILISGFIAMNYLSYFIKYNPPDNLNLSLLFFIYLLDTSIGYFFYAYKRPLLIANQNMNVISNINSLIKTVTNLLQILIIFCTKNYYYYLWLLPLSSIADNLLVNYYSKKYYPGIIANGQINKTLLDNIKKKLKGLLITKICIATRNSLDSIFISTYLGLTLVAIYNNYYSIMIAIDGCIGVLSVSMLASVGNSLITETIKKNYNDFRLLNFIFNWIGGFATCCLFNMFQPFMKLWLGKNFLLEINNVILICLYFYILRLGSVRALYHDAAGLWWEARYRAILESIINLILNYFLTKSFGVWGTILSTIIAITLINYFYGTFIVFKYYFKGISPKEYFTDNLKYMLSTFICILCVWHLTNIYFITDLPKLILSFIISVIVFNTIYGIIFCKTEIYNKSLRFLYHRKLLGFSLSKILPTPNL